MRRKLAMVSLKGRRTWTPVAALGQEAAATQGTVARVGLFVVGGGLLGGREGSGEGILLGACCRPAVAVGLTFSICVLSG